MCYSDRAKYKPSVILNPRFLSSRYSWVKAHTSHKKCLQKSPKSLPRRLYCALILPLQKYEQIHPHPVTVLIQAQNAPTLLNAAFSKPLYITYLLISHVLLSLFTSNLRGLSIYRTWNMYVYVNNLQVDPRSIILAIWLKVMHGHQHVIQPVPF